MKSHSEILYYKYRKPHVHNLGKLKGVPENRNPWAGQTRTLKVYGYLFAEKDLCIVNKILLQLKMKESDAIPIEELEKKGEVTGLVVAKEDFESFNDTLTLNYAPYAIDFEEKYNKQETGSISVVVLKSYLPNICELFYGLAQDAKDIHTKDPYVRKEKWRIKGQTIEIKYNQKNEIINPVSKKLFDSIMQQEGDQEIKIPLQELNRVGSVRITKK